MAKIKRPKKRIERYGLGDFVIKNQQNITNGANGLASLGAMTGDATIAGATSGIASGAALGSAIMPGIGTALGAAGGALLGVFNGNKQKRLARERKKMENNIRHTAVVDQYESELDTYNDNPYGTYAEGGDVNKEVINIEKGELEIDPENGKIKRKYKNFNPESGGKYVNHTKDNKDPIHNFVTADIGSFIITKKDAKKYEDAVNNNDKLYQNSIMANIRNKKKLNSNKYATGGGVKPGFYTDRLNYLQSLGTVGLPELQEVNTFKTPSAPVVPFAEGTKQGLSKANITIPEVSPTNTNTNTTNTSKPVKNGDKFENRLASVLGNLSGLSNIFAGNQSPDYLQYKPSRMDIGLRQKTLANLPEEMSVNPLLNSINESIYTTDRNIENNTSNSSIARALKNENRINGRKAMNDAYIGVANANNNTRASRAGVYANLSAQDDARSNFNSQMMLNVDQQNSMMSAAKKQQVNTGISQLIENFQNNRLNKRLSQNDQLRLQLLNDMNPYLKNYLPNWEPYLNK